MNLIDVIKEYMSNVVLHNIVIDFDSNNDCKYIRELYIASNQGNCESWDNSRNNNDHLMYLSFSLEQGEIYMYWAYGVDNNAKSYISDGNEEYKIVSNKMFSSFLTKHKKKKLDL